MSARIVRLYSESDLRRVRLKQAHLAFQAGKLGLPDAHRPLSDDPASPTLGELRERTYPHLERLIDEALKRLLRAPARAGRRKKGTRKP